MAPVNRVICMVAAVAAIACSSTNQSIQNVQTTAVVRRAPFPADVRGFRLSSAEQLPGTPVESVYRYAPPTPSRARVSAFRYVVPDSVLGTLTRQEWADRESRSFGTVMAIMKQRGQYDTVEVAMMEPGPVVRDGMTVPGSFAVAGVRQRGVALFEFQFVYGVGDRFLKVRATMPAAELQTSGIREFAEELAWQVGAPRSRP